MHPRGTLLIVDDEKDDRDFIADAIAAVGQKAPGVHQVDNGRAAVDYLAGRGIYAARESHPIPRVVLLDIKMPFLDGFEVLSWIRSSEALDCVPVLMLTGSAQPGDIKRAFSLGANAFMVKPASISDLREMMRAVVAFWFECNVSAIADWR